MNDEIKPPPTAENRFTENARPLIRISGFAALVGVGLAAGTLYDTVVNRLDGRISHNSECCAEFRQYREEDSGQRHYWVDRIGENVKRIRDVEQNVSKAHARLDVLSSDAYIKPNAYRRSEGRELEKRIQRLEAEVYE